MKLQLYRPLVFLDLETTGPSIYTDRIVEIGLLKIFPDGTRETFESLVNPGMPIPPETTAIHGISDNDVAQAPPFERIADKVLAFLEGSDISGFNVLKFDLPILSEELLRYGKRLVLDETRVVDSMILFHKMEERNLQAALRFYCRSEEPVQHRALADASASLRVLEGQLEHYGALIPDIEFLAEFTTGKLPPDWEGKFVWGLDGEPYFAFGKYKGKSLREAFLQEPSYYYWMMEKDFLLSTKAMITEKFYQLYPHKKPAT